MNYKIICRADKANKQGEAPLYLQFYHEGRRKKVTTGIAINPRFWDDMAQQAKAQQNNLLGFVILQNLRKYCHYLYGTRK